MQIDKNQQNFLSNKENKTACGHWVIQSKGDADTLIVRASLDLATCNKITIVIADDTDIFCSYIITT